MKKFLLILMLMCFFILTGCSKNSKLEYIIIDVNPSIRLGVNDNKVIEVDALNDDADKIIGDFKNKDLNDVIKEIVNNLNDEKFLDKNKTILITTNSSKFSDLVKDMIKEEVSNDVLVINQNIDDDLSGDVYDDGMSIGRKAFIESLVSVNKGTSFDDLKDKSLDELYEMMPTTSNSTEVTTTTTTSTTKTTSSTTTSKKSTTTKKTTTKTQLITTSACDKSTLPSKLPEGYKKTREGFTLSSTNGSELTLTYKGRSVTGNVKVGYFDCKVNRYDIDFGEGPLNNDVWFYTISYGGTNLVYIESNLEPIMMNTYESISFADVSTYSCRPSKASNNYQIMNECYNKFSNFRRSVGVDNYNKNYFTLYAYDKNARFIGMFVFKKVPKGDINTCVNGMACYNFELVRL